MGDIPVSLISLRNALGGEVRGGWLRCPGPGHSRKDRSLSVRPKPDGGWHIKTFSPKDDWRDCDDYVRARLGLGPWQPDPDVRPPQRRQHIKDQDDAAMRRQSARQIWDGAGDPRDTPVEAYLASRKLILPPELCGSVLRFHPACPWENGRVACLIAPYREFVSDEVVAVHRIRVDQPERWPKIGREGRKMLGPAGLGAIKLDPAADTLAISEGLETALAGRQLGFRPAWCLGSARGIEYFAPLDGVDELVILGENDHGPNAKAVEACRKLWRGRDVFRAMPTVGKDFNDVLMGAAK